MSWIVAKLALPMTRFSIMRPATLTVRGVCFQHFVGIISIFPMKILCKIVAAEIIGKSIACLTQRSQLGAALFDKLDLCVNPIMRFVQIFLQSVIRQFQLLFS